VQWGFSPPVNEYAFIEKMCENIWNVPFPGPLLSEESCDSESIVPSDFFAFFFCHPPNSAFDSPKVVVSTSLTYSLVLLQPALFSLSKPK
jgi:hypothetical protein